MYAVPNVLSPRVLVFGPGLSDKNWTTNASCLQRVLPRYVLRERLFYCTTASLIKEALIKEAHQSRM